jgi:tetratricopeptide (TPR) repeat protein
LDDVFAIQSDIAKRVAGALEVKLLATEEVRIRKQATRNTESYTLYLKGRYYWNKRSKDSVTKAIEYFQLAIEGDPNFALAYVGLSDSYSILADYRYMSSSQAHPKAMAAATKALQLDDTLAEAHASFALTLAGVDWNWSAAESEFKRALDLNPNYASAHQWYSINLRIVGRYKEALAEARKALALDPLSPIMSMNVGDRLAAMGEYDLAVEYLLKALAIEPNFVPALRSLAGAYVEKSMYDEAMEAVRTLGSIAPWQTRSKVYAAEVYARLGNKEEARRILQDNMQEFIAESVPPIEIASVHAALGQKDRAFEWLDKEYELHGSGIAYLKAYPVFDSLRSDTRFHDLLRKVGLGE